MSDRSLQCEECDAPLIDRRRVYCLECSNKIARESKITPGSRRGEKRFESQPRYERMIRSYLQSSKHIKTEGAE